MVESFELLSDAATEIVSEEAAGRIDRSRRSLTDTGRAISTRTTVPDPELVQVIAELDSGIATMARALRGFTADGLSDQADENESGTSVDDA
ncbi:hypothetical protein BH20ACT24_BH20ACT24_19330 [soil metagenome]